MKATRLKQLEQLILSQDFVTVEEICRRFGVHENTARSDIKELVRQGIAVKQYGGVKGIKTDLPTTFSERDQIKFDAREIIGAKAAQLLSEGDIIYVDSGTTTAQLFRSAAKLPESLTVITNNLNVVNWVLTNTKYTVFVLPGMANRQLNSIASLETIDSLRNYNIQKSFIGCRKIATTGSLTSASSVDAKIKETAIRLSQQVYLLADAEKIGVPEMYSFANISQVNCWICDVVDERVNGLAKNNNIIVM